MQSFWRWYLDSGKIDGSIQPRRRLLLAAESILITALWFWLLVKWMPESKEFYVRVFSNPFTIIAFVGMYLYTKSVEYLQYKLVSTGQQQLQRGLFAQNDGKIFAAYKLVFGKDLAYKLPLVLGLGSMASWLLAVILIMAQGPF